MNDKTKQAQKKQKPRKRFNIRIQIGFLTFLILTGVLVSSIILLPLTYMTRNNIKSLVVTINEKIMNDVSNRIERLFGKALETQSIIRDVFAEGIVDINDPDQREQYYYTLLKANRDFTWISFGYPNGDFFGVQRENPDSINIIQSNWEGEEALARRRIDFYRQENGEFIFQARHIIPGYDYFAPQRSWYKQAIRGIDHVWTDVYVLNTSKKPGINSAIALDINGNFTGVITIVFELEDISFYLKDQQVGRTGSLFIIDSREQLIAARDPAEVVHQASVGETPQLRKIGESKNPHVKMIDDALGAAAIGIADIDSLVNYYHHDPRTGQDYFITLKHTGYLDWTVAVVVPAADFLREIERNSLVLMIIVSAALLLVMIILISVSKALIVKPILSITDQLVYIRDFDLTRIRPVTSHIKEINQLSRSIMQMTHGLLSFQKYIPTELVRDMISQGIQAEMGGREKELTIFFSDLVSFTKVFERVGNHLIHQLGEYLSEMSDIILKNRGAIDKYIGDSIMAFWGAPVENRQHAVGACRSAVRSLRVLEKLRIRWQQEGKPPFYARFGINTGTVVVGNIGSSRRLDYTVMGDPVNLASRLESLNKVYKTEILIGRETYNKARAEIIARKIDSVAVYGKTKPQDIYELIAMRDEVKVTDKFGWITEYEKAFGLYQSREWKEAIRGFRKVSELRGQQDYPALLLIYHCKKFLKSPPPGNWDGTTVMRSK